MNVGSVAFGTQYPTDKILFESPTATVGVGAAASETSPGQANVTVAHNFGSSVIVNLMYSIDGSNFYPMGTPITINPYEYIVAYGYADASNAYIHVSNFILSGKTVTYYYNLEGI